MFISTFFLSWSLSGEQQVEIWARPGLSSTTGALMTWNGCVRLLCPASPLCFPPDAALQQTKNKTNLQFRTSQSSSNNQKSMPRVASVTFSSDQVSLPPFLAEHLLPVDYRKEEVRQGRGEVVSLVCSFPPASVLSHDSFSPAWVLFTGLFVFVWFFFGGGVCHCDLLNLK